MDDSRAAQAQVLEDLSKRWWSSIDEVDKEALEAGAAALRAPSPVAWQPIETYDAAFPVVIIATDEGSVGEAFLDPLVNEWRWTAHEFEEIDGEATHWMPLPDPPALSPSPEHKR